ncbi:MAG: chlorite dismutase family protein [Terriglobales bacterium]
MSVPLDIREKGGPRNGEPQFSDRRLFMQLQAFTGCTQPTRLIKALQTSAFESVLYTDVNDPRGVALLTWTEQPDFFTGALRRFLLEPPFNELQSRPEYAMLGRSYAIGYEPDLEDSLLHRPRRTVLSPGSPWAIWYPLRRRGEFSQLAPEEQSPILGEHGRIGRSFGEAGFAYDVRLACFGLDKNDNDFVIGLVGPELYPLSACIQAMRRTRQTSQFIEKMGPFFTGRAVWQSVEVGS